jgi:hypothetical protein
VADLKYNKGTDTEHEIKLDSQLIYATWRTGKARAGGRAGFEVMTAMVGNGAKIKIKGKSENGEKLGKIKDVIKNNKYVGEFEIPEDIDLDDAVYFEVELPGNGLSGESNRIPAAPAIEVTHMKWSAEEARRGDMLTLSADVSGCGNGTEATVTIYEYDRDNIHDKIVTIPATVEKDKIELTWEYEYHEDTDEIATDEELKKYGKSYNPPEYFFVIEIDGQKFGRDQESGLLVFRDWIEVLFTNGPDIPMEGEKYILHLPDGTTREGEFDGDGKLREDKIPPGRVFVEIPAFFDIVEVSEKGRPGEEAVAQPTETSTDVEEQTTEDSIHEVESDDETDDDAADDYDDDTGEDTTDDVLEDPDEDGEDMGLDDVDETYGNAVFEVDRVEYYEVAGRHCVSGQDYHLALMHDISAILVDSEGVPVREEVEYKIKDEDGEFVCQGVTSADGVIERRQVAVGDYEVIIKGESYWIASVPDVSLRQLIVCSAREQSG